MSAARDELEKCFIAYGIGHVDSHVLAEALVGAGWVKPRTITTAEELDALPNESLILDARNTCREGLTSVKGRNWWRAMGPSKVLLSKDVPLPATVLHEGQA